MTMEKIILWNNHYGGNVPLTRPAVLNVNISREKNLQLLREEWGSYDLNKYEYSRYRQKIRLLAFSKIFWSSILFFPSHLTQAL